MMKESKYTKYYLPLLLLLVISSCNTTVQNLDTEELPYYNEATFTPSWIESDKEKRKFHKIPEFKLINQNGDSITEVTVKDKIYVVDFFFTACPGICPKMTTNMHKVQEVFKDDQEVLLLSHSVTPESDSVAVLKDYAELNEVDAAKWHLLTGDQKTIYDLGRNAYFVEEDLGLTKSEGDFIHTENFVLVDQQRHIRGIYNGLNKTSVNQLIEDIKSLK